MEEKQQHEVDKNIDDVILPGFRFHPTDEELVGFYLKRRIQQAALPIELIKQVDIYKYDPWDLPKLAATGEKEWYFYCPRDRKYRNSARPNRVTGAGFWKATGTDRPIYSSDGTKCVGLKKSLVFYRGRAAKGIKTDWMMHEFRLPSITDTVHQKKLFDRTIPINDSWVICRIFKKTNSMAQRALSYSWVGTNSYNNTHHHPHLSNISSSCCTTEIGSSHHIPLQTTTNHHTHDYFQHPTAANPFSPTNSLDQLPFYKLINHQTPRTSFHFPTISTNRDLLNHNNNFIFPNHHGHDISSVLHLPKSSSSVDVSSLILNLAAPSTVITTSGEVTKLTTTSTQNTDFALVSPPQLNGLPISSLLDLPVNHLVSEEQQHLCSTQQKSQHSNETHSNQSPGFKSMGFPLSFPTCLGDPWKPTISWEETTPSCPSEMSTSYSSNKCYT